MTRRRWFVIVGAVFVALVAWAIVPPSERPFYDYLDERRAAGLPTTYEELLGPMPPAAENGVEELAAAVPWVLKEFGPSTSWKNSGFDVNMIVNEDGPTPEQIAEETPAAVRIRPWTERRDAVLAKPRLRFPVALGPEGFRTWTHVTVLQNVQRFLMMQAQAEDDPQRRLAACRAMFLFARRIEPESLMTWMVGTAFVSGGVAALRRGVEWGRIDPVAAREACDELLRGSRREGLRAAFRAEAVWFLTAYRELVEGRATPRSAKSSYWWKMSRRFDRLMSHVRGIPDFPELEPGMPRTIVGVCRGLDAAAAEPGVDVGPAMAQRLDPSGAMREFGIDVAVSKCRRTNVQCDAQTRLARVALAVAELHAKTGAWPASLDELAPMFPDGVPADPFTDKPFAYTPTKDGVRVSSAGRLPSDPVPEQDTRSWRGLVWELTR